MIALGADHGGFELKEAIKKHLDEQGVEYIDCGTYSAESIDYAPIAKATCEKDGVKTFTITVKMEEKMGD